MFRTAMIGYGGQRRTVAIAAFALLVSGAALARPEEPAYREPAGKPSAAHASIALPATVRIGVFGLFRPRELVLRPAPGGVVVIRAGGEMLRLEGDQRARLLLAGDSVECLTDRQKVVAHAAHASGYFQEPTAGTDFVLIVPGKLERRFHGTLDVSVVHSESEGRDPGPGMLTAVVTMDLETAVASVVAAESPPGAPLEALKAQAVVSRSYYVAARAGHHGFDFCDTTHCQFLRSPPAKSDPAWIATVATRGLILNYRGRPLAALYSASCGGRTHALADVGVRADLDAGDYPYFSVDCPYCLRHPRAWTCRIDRIDPADSKDGALLLAGVSSEAARLRMARKVGWSVLPGGNYAAHVEGATLVVRGRGAGHGVGLCQAGARALTRAGADFRETLMHYYPNTSLAAAGE